MPTLKFMMHGKPQSPSLFCEYMAHSLKCLDNLLDGLSDCDDDRWAPVFFLLSGVVEEMAKEAEAASAHYRSEAAGKEKKK